ncbi:MAG: hypothetical protein AAB839_00015 [Patescibacteria group bacterium]
MTKEILLLLALSCATEVDGLTIGDAARELGIKFGLVLNASTARAASKTLIKGELIANGIKKIPGGKRKEADHYRLTAKGRVELARVTDLFNQIMSRTGHVTVKA